jgi:FG-GAP-like repeat/FG-GAP repeat
MPRIRHTKPRTIPTGFGLLLVGAIALFIANCGGGSSGGGGGAGGGSSSGNSSGSGSNGSSSTVGPPTGVMAVSSGANIAVSWTSLTGATSYNVYRSTASSFTPSSSTLIASAITGTSYSDNGLPLCIAYNYVVTAVDSAGEGSPSPQTTASTGSATGPSVVVSNLLNKGVVHSGFMIGTACPMTGATPPPITAVQVNPDSTSYSPATGTTTWSLKLPTGSSMWKDGSKHTLAVRSYDGTNFSAVTTLTVYKGTNQDVNGDGYADLVVSDANVPATYIFNSPGSGGIPSETYTSANATLSGVSGAVVGDINGDGFADVVTGASNSIYIFHSAGTSGFTSGTSSNANTTLVGPASVFGSVGNTFGSSIAVGDVNGDGYADLVVGSDEAFEGTFQGAAFVFNSSSTGIPSATCSTASCPQANAILVGPSNYAFFGTGAAMGDFNGDGYADVVISSEELNGFSGGVFIFQSAGTGGIASSNLSSGGTAHTTLAGPAHSGIDGPSSGFGTGGIAVGDVNGDGYADLVVGDTASTDLKLFVFQSAGSAGVASENLASGGTATSTITGVDGAIAVGDVNGDGYADVIGTGTIVYVLQSAGTSGITITSSGSATATLTGPTCCTFGNALALADFNGDGYLDLVVNAPFTANAAVFVFNSAGTSGIATVNCASTSTCSGASATLTGVGGLFGYGLAANEKALPGLVGFAAITEVRSRRRHRRQVPLPC